MVPSQIVSRLVFWILMLTFLLSAVETLGLEAVTATIDRLIAYLPNVIAAAFIVVIGLLLARFVRNLVASGAATANLVYAQQLGSAAYGAVVVMVGVLTAQQLGVNTQLLMTVITALIAAAALAMGLAFALGSREVVGAILAGHYVRQSLREGDLIEVENRKGRVERIGPVDTLLRDGESTWSIPNVKLLRETLGR
jgi:small-conductance mechanosensitive channel